jgi:hypothetical protein
MLISGETLEINKPHPRESISLAVLSYEDCISSDSGIVPDRCDPDAFITHCRGEVPRQPFGIPHREEHISLLARQSIPKTIKAFIELIGNGDLDILRTVVRAMSSKVIAKK